VAVLEALAVSVAPVVVAVSAAQAAEEDSR
jgi:hypothetical protein